MIQIEQRGGKYFEKMLKFQRHDLGSKSQHPTNIFYSTFLTELFKINRPKCVNQITVHLFWTGALIK